MLIKSKTIRNYKLRGTDGDVGSVRDLYFDDKYWTVRYLVANTGNWLNSRQVLISPYFLNNLDHDSEVINVDLTRNQIENSPALDQDTPVSRQYEESYHTYFGYPFYWSGPNMWGASPYLVRDRNKWPNARGANTENSGNKQSGSFGSETGATGTYSNESSIQPGTNTGLTNSGNPVSTDPGSSWNSSLRSIEDVNGHKIHTTDEDKIGHVDDFIIDDDTWTIRYLIVNTGNLFTGKKVLISPEWIERISWDDSKVYLNMTKETLKESPEYSDESGLTRDYESSLFSYYNKTPYWSPEPSTHDYSHSRVDTEGRYSGY
jgi:uncharacterized protein YrrD